MRQVGTDDDEHCSSPPQAFEHLGDLCCRSAANGQRNQLELAQHRLQERELNFQRMLQGMRGVADDHLRQLLDRGEGFPIKLNDAQRRRKGAGRREGYPFTATRCVGPSRITRRMVSRRAASGALNAGRDRAGIDIAGMRGDDCLG